MSEKFYYQPSAARRSSVSATVIDLRGNASDQISHSIGVRAIRALYRELALSPKPGLVSPIDSGSHRDMNFQTFVRSIHSLRSYFTQIAKAGTRGATFSELQALGIEAERHMLFATGGVNTHRGAIFNLGFLCAAAGQLSFRQQPLNPDAIAQEVKRSWGEDIQYRLPPAPQSHGTQVTQRYGVGGARMEAALGFPSVIQFGLPAYRAMNENTKIAERAALHALFTLIAHLDDTNLLWRGGVDGLNFAREQAQNFLARGSVMQEDFDRQANHIHQGFVARNLSPGGAADLLGVTLFLAQF